MKVRLSIRLSEECQQKLLSLYKRYDVTGDTDADLFRKLIDVLHDDEFVRAEDLGNDFSDTPFTEKRKPIEEFLKNQGRFSLLFKPKKDEKKIQELQDCVQHRWDILMKTFT